MAFNQYDNEKVREKIRLIAFYSVMAASFFVKLDELHAVIVVAGISILLFISQTVFKVPENWPRWIKDPSV